MRQAGFLAAAGIYALDNQVERLKEDHARARALGEMLSKLPAVSEIFPVATNIVIEDDLRVRFDLHSEWGTASIRLGVRGVHHVGNALAAAALALLWDVPMSDVVDGLEQAALSPWRMELHVSRAGVRVLIDAYNAGTASMEAALRAVAQLPTTHHHAVLGPMA